MLISITGTPGVGKTAVALELTKRGYTVRSLIDVAKEYNCIIDEEDGEYVVDVEKLSRIKIEGIVEGHLSHYLNADKVIVLRCNPLIVKTRLENRGWDYEKVMDNVEAELLDVILIEALEMEREVYEIDTTDRSVKEVADAVEDIIRGKFTEKYQPGKVDWLTELQDRLEEVVRL